MKDTRKRVRPEDLVPEEGFPVGRGQPSSLPVLKEEPLSPEVVESLQKPAAMLDYC